jgi:hypothetical protein
VALTLAKAEATQQRNANMNRKEVLFIDTYLGFKCTKVIFYLIKTKKNG